MNNQKKFFTLQSLVEAGLMLALAYVLGRIKIYKMPYGGSVSLSMLPIVFFAVRWGVIKGFIVGALFGLLNLLIDPYVIHPAQLLLDYPLPSAFVGLAGLSVIKDKTNFSGFIPTIILGYILKFVCHYLSGVVFFAEYTPEGMQPSVYSFLYNIQYNGPELLIILVVCGLLWKPLTGLLKKQS